MSMHRIPILSSHLTASARPEDESLCNEVCMLQPLHENMHHRSLSRLCSADHMQQYCKAFNCTRGL